MHGLGVVEGTGVFFTHENTLLCATVTTLIPIQPRHRHCLCHKDPPSAYTASLSRQPSLPFLSPGTESLFSIHNFFHFNSVMCMHSYSIYF